ncbi:MAG: hypothetical protein IH934_03985 [Nanoarchaeota archaeon]|nr:hypothetical protein [Nanoarchaeota archaeon]
MAEEKITLFNHRLSNKLPEGRTPEGVIDSVNAGEVLRMDLGGLASLCRLGSRHWSIAKYEPNKKDVKLILSEYGEWYEALREIRTSEGYFPLEEALEKYQT